MVIEELILVYFVLLNFTYSLVCKIPSIVFTSCDMTGLLTGDVTQFPSRIQKLHHQVEQFVNNKIIPLEQEIADYYDNNNTKWTVNSKIEQLKVSLVFVLLVSI